MSDEYVPQCGDVGFVGRDPGEALFNDAIATMTRGAGESRSLAQHQFQVISDGEVLEASAVHEHGVLIRPWAERVQECIDNDSHYIVFRPVMSFMARNRLDRVARGLEGKRYGYAEILLQAMDGGLRKLGLLPERFPLFTRLGSLAPWTVICSGVGNRTLYEAGVLPRKFLFLSPDGTYDHAKARWPVVAQDDEDYWCGIVDVQ